MLLRTEHRRRTESIQIGNSFSTPASSSLVEQMGTHGIYVPTSFNRESSGRADSLKEFNSFPTSRAGSKAGYLCKASRLGAEAKTENLLEFDCGHELLRC